MLLKDRNEVFLVQQHYLPIYQDTFIYFFLIMWEKKSWRNNILLWKNFAMKKKEILHNMINR